MKSFILLLFMLNATTLSAQYVTLSKAIKSNDSKDKFFYKINPQTDQAEYLGEIEVQGFSKNDPEIFSLIYKKAKTIGANAFSLKLTENLEGNIKFNPEHYYLNLYHIKILPQEENTVYILSSSNKGQKIMINNKSLTIQPRTFLKLTLQPSEVQSISTGGLLGSKILLSQKNGQPAQYFQILPAGFHPDHLGQGGLNLKSGDIILLEKSYAQFLTTVYTEHK